MKNDPRSQFFFLGMLASLMGITGIYLICKSFESEEKLVLKNAEVAFNTKSPKPESLRVEGPSGNAQLIVRNANPIRRPTERLSMGHGSGHEIIIDFKTGKVTWKGTPDEAARQFWDAVVLAFPHIKKKIIEDYENHKYDGTLNIGMGDDSSFGEPLSPSEEAYQRFKEDWGGRIIWEHEHEKESRK